jgi:hypothetical protein
MAKSRWLILPGAVVILGMLCIAIFSLAVYVGKHGLSPDGLQYQAPRTNGAQLPGDALPAGLTGLPPRTPEAAGIIRRITRTHVELATREGPRTILLSEAVEVRLEDGRAGSRDNMKVGDLIAVFGQWTAGAARELEAEVIVRLPKK